MTTPTDVTYVYGTTGISSAHMNGINDWVYGWYGVMGETFTAAAARAAFGAAEVGANGTITSLTGLTGSITTAGAGIGYKTGAGGSVIQGATSGKSTAVSLDKPSGRITMNGASLGANTSVSFQLNNTVIAEGDIVFVQLHDADTANAYNVHVRDSRAGVCQIVLRNISAIALSEAVILTFVVIKAASA